MEVLKLCVPVGETVSCGAVCQRWGLWQDSASPAHCNVGIFLIHHMYRCHLLDSTFPSEGIVLYVAVDSLCLCEKVVLEPSMLPSWPTVYLHKYGLAGSSIQAGLTRLQLVGAVISPEAQSSSSLFFARILFFLVRGLRPQAPRGSPQLLIHGAP